MTIKTVAILLGEHPCIMNIFLGPVTVHYREVLLYYTMHVFNYLIGLPVIGFQPAEYVVIFMHHFILIYVGHSLGLGIV